MAEALELRVENLFGAVRGLKTVSKEAGRAVSGAIRPFVRELRSKAESKGRALGGVHAHTVRRGGIKHFVRGDGAGIELASDRVPTAAGAEYGATRYRQFPAWRGNQFTNPALDRVGYMIHPALREYLPAAEDQIADAIDKAIDEALG